MTRAVRCRTLAGALVLDLSSTGYEVDSEGVDLGARNWTRDTIKSPWVDGTYEVGKTLDVNTVVITVRCRASTWVGVETLHQALLLAVEPHQWLLDVEVDGVIYTHRASGADSVSSLSQQDFTYKERTVVLTIPVQPTLAIAGI